MSNCKHSWSAVNTRSSQCRKCGEIETSPCRERECVSLQARNAELEGALQLSHDISNGFSIAMIAAEAELAALREAARDQRALLARFDAAPDVGKMLRDLHSALLKESSDE